MKTYIKPLWDHIGRWNFAWKLYVTTKNEDNIKNENTLKNEDDLKTEDNLKTEDYIQTKDYFKTKDDFKNEENLCFEDCALPELTQPLLCLLMRWSMVLGTARMVF